MITITWATENLHRYIFTLPHNYYVTTTSLRGSKLEGQGFMSLVRNSQEWPQTESATTPGMTHRCWVLSGFAFGADHWSLDNIGLNSDTMQIVWCRSGRQLIGACLVFTVLVDSNKNTTLYYQHFPSTSLFAPLLSHRKHGTGSIHSCPPELYLSYDSLHLSLLFTKTLLV